MPPFAEAIIFIFLLIGAGYLVARTGLLKPETGAGLTDFVFTIALPTLLFHTLTTADLGGLSPWRLWATYFASVAVTWFAAHQVTSRIFRRDARASVVSGIAGSFSNLVLLGLPLILSVYGRQGVAILSLIVSIHTPVMMATIILLFHGAARADGVQGGAPGFRALAGGFFRQLLRNPLILGIFAGLFVRFTGLPVPPLAAKFIDTFATIAGPLALFAMGMGMRRFGIQGQVAAGTLLAVLKLMLMPAVALCLAWVLGLPPLTARIAVTAASLPSGVNSWLIAEQFKTGQRMAATAMTVGTGAAVLTTAFWLAVASAVFG